MDGCSQMVFCTHLSDTADREREGDRERGGKRGGETESEKGRKKNKKRCLLIAKSVYCCLEQTCAV